VTAEERAGARDGSARLAAAAAVLLALFAALFAAGSALGVWPQAPVGAFAGWDLWTGMAAGLGLLVHLVRRRGRQVQSLRLE
jgi:hypothetical protein